MDKNIKELLGRISPEVRREAEYSVSSYGKVDVKINQNENPFGLPDVVKKEIVEEISNLDWNRYPDRFGEDLSNAIAASLGISADSLLLGNGSNELVYLLADSLVNSSSKVLLPDPMFSLYEKAVRLKNAEVIEIPCDQNFDIIDSDFEDLIEQSQPDLIILTSPNNPTGRVISLKTIEMALRISPGFVVLDEAYFEFLEGRDGLALLDQYPNLIILRTFSKVLGLAGVRLGYIAAHPQLMQEFYKLRLPFMIDRISSAIGIRVLKETALISERLETLLSNKTMLQSELSKFEDIDFIESSANFILFKTKLKSATLVQKLAEQGVLIRDMSGYSKLENYVRVSVGTAEENKTFVHALTECGLK